MYIEPVPNRNSPPAILAPAQRSCQARHKAAHKLMADGLPVHSFLSLLADKSYRHEEHRST